MAIALLACLLACQSLLALAPGCLNPSVMSYVNFGTSPFYLDPLDVPAYQEIPTMNGGSVVNGNVLLSTSQAPGLYLSNQVFEVPDCIAGEIALTGEMGFQSTFLSGTVLSPNGADQDPNYGMGQLGMYDPGSGWLLSLIMTNMRIYAMYAWLQVPQTYAFGNCSPMNPSTFAYIVPIACRLPSMMHNLAIVLNSCNYAISYSVDNLERLLITRPGKLIDPRFAVSLDSETLPHCLAFPQRFQILVGSGFIPYSITSNPSVCQNAIFDQCKEDITDAQETRCQYYPVQAPGSFNFLLQLTAKDWGVVKWASNYDCLRPPALCNAAYEGPLCSASDEPCPCLTESSDTVPEIFRRLRPCDEPACPGPIYGRTCPKPPRRRLVPVGPSSCTSSSTTQVPCRRGCPVIEVVNYSSSGEEYYAQRQPVYRRQCPPLKPQPRYSDSTYERKPLRRMRYTSSSTGRAKPPVCSTPYRRRPIRQASSSSSFSESSFIMDYRRRGCRTKIIDADMSLKDNAAGSSELGAKANEEAIAAIAEVEETQAPAAVD